MRLKKLPREFYTRNVLTVAKKLLGKIFVVSETYINGKKKNKINLRAKIVEVEAYDGSIDQAAHTYSGKTKRNEIMFGEGGYLYVYFIYGFHHCTNVVAGKTGKGEAVLLRAMEPLTGIELMSLNRFGESLIDEKKKFNLLNGPGKICQALGINSSHYGLDLTKSKIFIAERVGEKEEEIISAKRIGIKKSAEFLWRFYIKDNPYISKR